MKSYYQVSKDHFHFYKLKKKKIRTESQAFSLTIQVQVMSLPWNLLCTLLLTQVIATSG